MLSTFVFTNDKQGFEKLLAEIGMYSGNCDLSDARIGLESTGHYSINLQNYLLQKRLCVKIYNPLSVNLLRKAQSLRKTKTDKSDCKFLATLLFSDDSKSYSQIVLPISDLRNLTRSRHRLVCMRSKLKLSLSRLITVLFPELPSVVWSVNQKSCYALLSEFPTAKDISTANIVRLTNVLSTNSHGKYGREKSEQIRNLARNSIGLDSRAVGFELQQTIRLTQNLQTEIDLLDVEIKKIMRGIASPVLSIPGIGYVLGSIIVSEIGNIENFADPAKLLGRAHLCKTKIETALILGNKTDEEYFELVKKLADDHKIKTSKTHKSKDHTRLLSLLQNIALITIRHIPFMIMMYLLYWNFGNMMLRT